MATSGFQIENWTQTHLGEQGPAPLWGWTMSTLGGMQHLHDSPLACHTTKTWPGCVHAGPPMGAWKQSQHMIWVPNYWWWWWELGCMSDTLVITQGERDQRGYSDGGAAWQGDSLWAHKPDELTLLPLPWRRSEHTEPLLKHLWP